MKNHKFRLRLLPVIVFSAIVFLIVRAQSYSAQIEETPNLPYNSSMEIWDLFSKAKASVILFVAVWAVLTMTYLLITGQMKVKKTIIYIPMFIYTLGVVLSYIYSSYKWIAWNGNFERFEGTRTILCYMFMLFYTINVVDELRDALIVVSSILAGVFVACLIGVSQLIGHDLFLTGLGRVLLLGSKDYSIAAMFLPGQVYQTVANMNYVGMYMSLIVPIVLFTLIYFCSPANNVSIARSGIDSNKRCVIVIFTVILLLLICLNVYGAGSLGGVVGISASIILLLIILSKNTKLKIALAIMGCAGMVAVFCYVYVTGSDSIFPVDYIETGIDNITVSLDGNELNVSYDRDTDEYELSDCDGAGIAVFYFAGEDGIYQVDDERFSGEIVIMPVKDDEGNPCVVIEFKKEVFGFVLYEDGARYTNPFGNEISLTRIDSYGFESHLSAGSGRGYIWSRTIPLLKDRILIGSGADCFMFVFPQADYAGKYSSGAPLSAVCDKPHNMFLNMMIGTGGVSLLAFLLIIVLAMWKAFCVSEDKIFIKIIATGIIGFLVAGITCDSSICTMPIFYGLLGTVIAIGI